MMAPIRVEPGPCGYGHIVEIARTFPLAPQAVSEARRAVATLAEQLPRPVLDDVLVVVSELVTNSVLHTPPSAGEQVTLRVEIRRDTVRIMVETAWSDFEPTVGGSEPVRESGYGMLLVERLSDRWGKVANDGMWAEISFAA
jgi:anti-sigma regulatory factor (Ser/Thr protein kinase)